MKRLLLAGAIAACAMIFTGCGFVFAARTATYTPAPCYDCRYVPVGRAAYARCGHYEIRVVRDGYYYRPSRHHGHAEYTFVKFESTGKHAHNEIRHERRSGR